MAVRITGVDTTRREVNGVMTDSWLCVDPVTYTAWVQQSAENPLVNTRYNPIVGVSLLCPPPADCLWQALECDWAQRLLTRVCRASKLIQHNGEEVRVLADFGYDALNDLEMCIAQNAVAARF